MVEAVALCLAASIQAASVLAAVAEGLAVALTAASDFRIEATVAVAEAIPLAGSSISDCERLLHLIISAPL